MANGSGSRSIVCFEIRPPQRCFGGAGGVAVVEGAGSVAHQAADPQLAGHNGGYDRAKACAVGDQTVVCLLAADTAHVDLGILGKKGSRADVNVAPAVGDQAAGLHAAHQAAHSLLYVTLVRKCEVRPGHRAVVDYRVACQNTGNAAHGNLVSVIRVVKLFDLHVQVLDCAAVHNAKEADDLIAHRRARLTAGNVAHGVALSVEGSGEAAVLAVVAGADGRPGHVREIQVAAQGHGLIRVVLAAVDGLREGQQGLNALDEVGGLLGAAAAVEDAGVLLLGVLQGVLHGGLDGFAADGGAGLGVHRGHGLVVAETQEPLQHHKGLLPVAGRLRLLQDFHQGDLAVGDGHLHRDGAPVAHGRAGVNAVLVGAGVGDHGHFLKEGSDGDILIRHDEGIAAEHLVACHQAAGLQPVTRVGADGQSDGLARNGGGPVGGNGAVHHLRDGDAVALAGLRGAALLEDHVIHGDGAAAALRGLKDEGELSLRAAESRGDADAALAGDVLHGAVLIHPGQMILGVPEHRPGLALVQGGLHGELDGTGAEFIVGAAEIEAQEHALRHLDLRQDELLVLRLGKHDVLVAERHIAAVQSAVLPDLPGLVILADAVQRPALRQLVAAVEVLMDAVGQGHGLLGEGRGDGMRLGDALEGVAGNRTHRRAVHLHVPDLIALGGGNDKGLIRTLRHGHRAVGVDAAALTGGSGDGELGGLRGSLPAAGSRQLHVVHINGAAAGVAAPGLIAEGELHAVLLILLRNGQRDIRGFHIVADHAGNQFGIRSVPQLIPGLAAVQAGFQRGGGLVAGQGLAEIALLAVELEAQRGALARQVQRRCDEILILARAVLIAPVADRIGVGGAAGGQGLAQLGDAPGVISAGGLVLPGPALRQGRAGSAVVEVLIQQRGSLAAGGCRVGTDADVIHRAAAAVLARRALIAEGQLGGSGLQLHGDIHRHIGGKGVAAVADLIIDRTLELGGSPDGRPVGAVRAGFQLHGIVAVEGRRLAADIAEGDRAAAIAHVQHGSDEPLVLLGVAGVVVAAGSCQRLIRIIVLVNRPCRIAVGAFQRPAIRERAVLRAILEVLLQENGLLAARLGGKLRRDAVVGLDIGEGIAGLGSDGLAVHLHI